MPDWPFPRRTPQHVPVVSDAGLDAAALPWETTLPEGPSTAPVLLDDGLYLGTSPTENAVVALDAATGDTGWSRGFDDWVTGLTTDGESLYVSCGDASVHAVDPATGAVEWRRDFPRRGARAALPVGGRLFVTTAHGMLYALDPDDGSERWHAWHDNLTPSAPAVGADHVYVAVGGRRGSGGGTVHAYGLDGDPAWTFDVEDRLDCGYDLAGVDPLVVGDRLFASTGATLFALDVATGELEWQAPLGQADELRDHLDDICVAPDAVVAGTRRGAVHSLEPSTGAERWRVPSTGRQVGQHFAVVDGRLYATGYDDGLTAYDAATGSVLTRIDDVSPHITPVIVHDRVAFFGTNPSREPGTCHAIRL